MENKLKTKTNMMDLLPDEMVIEILDHFEDLADLLTLPKVNYRINLLSKYSKHKSSRNHLVLKDFESDVYSDEEFQRKMEEKIIKCTDLKSVTYITCHQYLLTQFLTLMPPIFINELNKNSKHKITKDDIDILTISNYGSYIYSFLKKSTSDMGRVLQMAPSAMTYISVRGSPQIFQTLVENSTETLNIAVYKGTTLTSAHLSPLGNCEKLERIVLAGKLVISGGLPESFHNIQSKEIVLEGNFHCPYVDNIFFSETLEILSTYHSTIAGFENELFTKCTKLKQLNINLWYEEQDLLKVYLIASIFKLVDTLKQHETLQAIIIMHLDQDLRRSLSERLSECLESLTGSGTGLHELFIRGEPALFITLKS